jgi:hypothetical protein
VEKADPLDADTASLGTADNFGGGEREGRAGCKRNIGQVFLEKGVASATYVIPANDALTETPNGRERERVRRVVSAMPQRCGDRNR